MTVELKTRRPTGQVTHPLILLEGEQKSGKSWAIAELSASEKVGATYWLDLAEGAADEYGAIPGARYQIIEHTGSWSNIIGQVAAVREIAREENAAGRPPVVLGVDSMSAEWGMLKDWASSRARRSDKNRKKLAADPDAEIDVSVNYWNDAGSRHGRLMALLMTFPGIVVMTARGKETALIENGQPVNGKTSYSVEGHKNLAYDATVWVRCFRNADPMIVGARSVKYGKRPGKDKPEAFRDFSLERLIFDVLGYRPDVAHVRDLVVLDASALADLRDRVLDKSATVDDLRGLYAEAQAGDALAAVVVDNTGDEIKLGDLILARVREVDPKALKAAPAAAEDAA